MSSMEKRQDAVQKDVNQVHQQIKKLDTLFDESLRKCVAQQDRRMKDGFDELKSLLMEMSASGARPPSKRVRDVEGEDEERNQPLRVDPLVPVCARRAIHPVPTVQ